MNTGAERVAGGAKNGGGFFHLFDWNKKKTRKKLFATISPEGSKQSRKTFDILPPSTHLRLIVDDGDDGGIISSVKASSDYSCASSVTDEDGNGNRGGPGVVARLMGLDSMPTTAALDPYTSPIFEPRNLRDRQFQQNPNPGHEMNNSHHNFIASRPVMNSKKKMSEMKIQRMPSSPIEKFHTEMLPPRSAKSLPIGHHKLMSPIRNPRFISSKDAADIMEAASKFLEPGMIRNTNSNIRVPSLGPLRFRDSKESSSLAAATASSQQRTSMILESFKRPVESSTMKYLRGKRSWDGLDCETSCSRVSSSPNIKETKPVTAKSKRKSVSLAIQAKVNVQKREGLSRVSNNRMQVTQEELEEFKSTQPFKNQRNIHTDRLHKKTSTSASSSSVHKQNSHSQRTLIGKEKSSAASSSVSTCQNRKAFSGETSSFSAAASGTKSVNKPHVNPKSVYRRKGLPRANLEKETASSTSRVSSNLNRKKRSIEVDYDSDRSGRSDNLLAGRYEKRIQHNVIVDEQLKQQGEENDTDKQKNGMDVVSFTFTSPIVKQLSVSQPYIKKWDEYYYPNDSNGKKSPSHGILSKGGGDALSILLEQKLRELTLGLGKDKNYTTVSISQELSCFSEISSGVTIDNESSTCESGLSSINGQLAMNSASHHKLQEFENQNFNPLSISESQFSYESCISSESYSGSGGGLKSPSILSSTKTSLLEAELEVSDSASSSFREITPYQNRRSTPRISRKFHSKSYRWEVEYIKEILSVAELNLKNFATEYSNVTLTPLLFDQLETKTSQSIIINDSDEDGRRLNRKAMFDCVKECLDLENQCYFNTADYKMWKKGMMMFMGDFAEVLYKKVSGWSSMGDCMVDELVDKDMSSYFGRWVNFETDVFELGVEIEDAILGGLIDEVISEQFKI